jgi:hypothetical protein
MTSKSPAKWPCTSCSSSARPSGPRLGNTIGCPPTRRSRLPDGSLAHDYLTPDPVAEWCPLRGYATLSREPCLLRRFPHVPSGWRIPRRKFSGYDITFYAHQPPGHPSASPISSSSPRCRVLFARQFGRVLCLIPSTKGKSLERCHRQCAAGFSDC